MMMDVKRLSNVDEVLGMKKEVIVKLNIEGITKKEAMAVLTDIWKRYTSEFINYVADAIHLGMFLTEDLKLVVTAEFEKVSITTINTISDEELFKLAEKIKKDFEEALKTYAKFKELYNIAKLADNSDVKRILQEEGIEIL